MAHALEKKTVGRLPMDLAETKRNDSANLYKRLISLLIKTIVIMLCISLFFGVYFCILWWLTTDVDNLKNDNIIVVTKFHKPVNSTFTPANFEIILRLRNNTKSGVFQRRKRHIENKYIEIKNDKRKYADDQTQRVKDIISQHNVLCNDESHKQKCKELMEKLKLITSNNSNNLKIESRKKKSDEPSNILNHHSDIRSKISGTDSRDLESRPLASVPLDHHSRHYLNHNPVYSDYHYDRTAPRLTETCLLAKLMKQNFPHLHGVYDRPKFESEYPQMYTRNTPHNLFTPLNRNRDVSNENLQQNHPQDLEIEKLITEIRDVTSGEETNNITIHEIQCQPGEFSCNNGQACLDIKKLCDGSVDCSDVSDELQCTCKDRVDDSRKCDGYFDCPFGEDEMGCYGCNENEFSCEDGDINTKGTCFNKEQRCNNIADCFNHKDEADCIMLAPKLHMKPLFAISHTEGFLQRNYKGHWFAVCSNPYMWAHDACRRETGLIIRPPYIQTVKIEPTLKVAYINMIPGGLVEITNNCMNSSAVYVMCPDLLCGTRLQTSAHIMRENMAAENNIFGRNKRFLQLLKHPQILYDQSQKTSVKKERSTNDLMKYSATIDNARDKRSETRVVGGKPSQPAAWPWMVALYRDGIFHCGGVIINQNWIMSAAHCVHKFWQHYYEVRVGTLRRLSFSPQEQNHRVSHIIVNQKYNRKDMKNDISLLHVTPGIQFSRWVRPICLPSPDVAGFDWASGPQSGTICTAVGWGATAERGPDPDHLREVEVPIWSQCNHREDLDGNEICAGFIEGGKDACQGDSGGPLLCKNPMNAQQWYIAGIVSHGDGCGRKDEPGVYTRVSLFVSWIKQHISATSLPVIQPKQECPGFRCDSGILKCLPKKHMCDEIIDCLDGEDEINCEYKRPEVFRNIGSSSVKDQNFNTSEFEVLNLVKSELNNSIKPTYKPLDNLTEVIDTSKQEENLPYDTDDTDMNSIEQSSKKDHLFVHASTLEMNSEKSSQSTESLTENITSDPHQITSDEDLQLNNTVSLETTTNSLNTVGNFEHNTNINTNDNDIPDNISQNNNVVSDHFTSNQISVLDDDLSAESNLNGARNSNLDSSKDSGVICHSVEDSKKDCNRSLHNVTSAASNDTIRGDTIPNKQFEHINSLTNNNNNESSETSKIITAKPIKKRFFPSEFECGRIQQSIPYQRRCDQKADCEDGTDEFGCTCTDYLATFESNLLCDGNIDCSGGEDEIDCFECEEKQYLCKQDHLCIPSNYVCDGQRQCPSGDDEIDCLTLSNGKEVFQFYGKPEVRLHGYITKKHGDSWHVLCEEMMSIESQEEAANYVCRYMGFGSANRYSLNYINVPDSDLLDIQGNRRQKRNTNNSLQVHFTYKDNTENKIGRNVIIKNPTVIKEQCVPNITKTCLTLYVYCDHTLFTDFDVPEVLTIGKAAENPKARNWPWIAKLYVNGRYKCTGVLIDLSWVLVSHTCLQNTVSRLMSGAPINIVHQPNTGALAISITTDHYITIILGSQRTLENIIGPYEQVYKVDAKKELYRSKVTLLHLKEPAKYTVMVKPMGVSSPNSDDKNSICVAVGQNQFHSSFTMFLKEDATDCGNNHLCFTYLSNESNMCEQVSSEDFGAIISCHSNNGWYPAASYVKKDICDVNRVIAYEIENLKYEIKHSKDVALSNLQELDEFDNCLGVRCQRGRCIELHNVCNAIPNCEDGRDESKNACQLKNTTCSADPYYRGCECPSHKMKCRNGRCVGKELYKNGNDDCGDGTDEPGGFRCSDYLSRVMPSRLCDGILHCHDRSDEDPAFCKCFAKQGFECRGGHTHVNYCVAMDVVCDGTRDCPNGEDERHCLALRAPKTSPNGVGEVVMQSHGVWFSKCYPTQNHTKSELENICRQLGFLGGHSRQLSVLDNMKPHPHNSIVLDDFSDVTLNNKTSLKLRNTQLPIATAVADSIQNCYPLILECL